MPTGSLCAERNVIGSALADNLGLRRKDLRAIAVYSVGTLSSGRVSRKPSSLCAETNPKGTEHETSLHSSHAHSMRQILTKRAESWTEIEFTKNHKNHAPEPVSPAVLNRSNQEFGQVSVGRKSHRTIHSVSVGPFPNISLSSSEVQVKLDSPAVPRVLSGSPTLFTNKAQGLNSHSTNAVLSPNPNLLSRTINVEEGDMNPLKPCGACLEWLKKIAEVNPEFLIVTFTDINCEGVYVEQIDTAV